MYESMKSTRDIINAFLDAVENRDFDRALTFLSAEEFSYRGPIDHFDDPNVFIQDISSIGTILKKIERRRVFIDGNEACVIATYHTTMEDLRTTQVAHWIRLKHSKITSVESFFDVRAYARMFEPEK
jgi:ketosteroid isomerase-like protein